MDTAGADYPRTVYVHQHHLHNDGTHRFTSSYIKIHTSSSKYNNSYDLLLMHNVMTTVNQYNQKPDYHWKVLHCRFLGKDEMEWRQPQF